MKKLQSHHIFNEFSSSLKVSEFYHRFHPVSGELDSLWLLSPIFPLFISFLYVEYIGMSLALQLYKSKY